MHGFDNALDDNYFTELADIPKATAWCVTQAQLVDETEPAVGVAEFASALATWNVDTQEAVLSGRRRLWCARHPGRAKS